MWYEIIFLYTYINMYVYIFVCACVRVRINSFGRVLVLGGMGRMVYIGAPVI
jgi:hypothetical protein